MFLDGLFGHERRTRGEYISAGWLSGRLPHGQAGLESRIVLMEKPSTRSVPLRRIICFSSINELLRQGDEVKMVQIRKTGGARQSQEAG